MTGPAEALGEQEGGPHLRIVAMPRDTNPSGHIFGGWTLSQMDLACGIYASALSRGPVATVAVDAMRFLRPVDVGDEVSCWCSLETRGETSMRIKVETWARKRGGEKAEKVTEGVFTFVALDEKGQPRPVDAGGAPSADGG